MQMQFRRGLLLALCVAAFAFFVNAAVAAPPPTDPSVVQYVETIPTATGGAPSDKGNGANPTGGSSSTLPTGTTTITIGGGSSGKGHTTTTTAAKPPANAAGGSDTSNSGENPVSAAGHASGGLGTGATVLIVLAVLTLAALSFVALRRRARRI